MCYTCSPRLKRDRNKENTVYMKETSNKEGIQKFKCPKCGDTRELDYGLLRGIF